MDESADYLQFPENVENIDSADAIDKDWFHSFISVTRLSKGLAKKIGEYLSVQ